MEGYGEGEAWGEKKKVWMVYEQPGRSLALRQALDMSIVHGDKTWAALGNQQPLTH